MIILMVLTTATVLKLQAQQVQLKPGDLLFRGAKSGNLSEAIDRVTQTTKETHFSHIGLVESVGDTTWILHADTKQGSCRVSLNDFMHSDDGAVEVVAYRLKKEWQNSIPRAIERARQMLGKPYNFSYKLTDTAHYCSEFIYRAFEADSVFEMSPMTFKDPETGDFYPFWVEYYKELNIEIPEGLPGCNPNGLAASEKLIKIGVVQKPNE